MKHKFYYTKILWAGIIFWLGAIAARIVLSHYGYEPSGQDVLQNILEDYKDVIKEFVSPFIIFIALLGILVPILEEFLFRYWIKSKKQPLTLALFTAMGCYVAVCTFWWLGVGGVLVSLLLYYLFKDNPHTKTLALMFATSLLFALAHITGFSELNADSALIIIELFGLALVACWLVYNLNFWWACLLHVANNIFALLMILLSPVTLLYTPTEINFEKPLYSASLRPGSGSLMGCEYINDSTLVIKGPLPKIALLLVEKFNPDVISGTYSPKEFFKKGADYNYKREPHWNYTLMFHDTIPYHHAPQIVSDLANHSPLWIDTTYEYMYVIGIENHEILNKTTGDITNTLMGLADLIRVGYDLPVVLEKGTNEFYPVKYDFDLFSASYDIDQLSHILSEKLGLFIYKSTVHKIQVVTFSDRPK